MAKTIEESIMNAIMGAFAGQNKAPASKPSKSYMAIANTIPKVGEHFKCKRLEKNTNGELGFFYTETSTVQEVKKLACNVFVVTTRNSRYVTRVLYMPVEDVHFAIIFYEPQIGSCLNCHKLEFNGENVRSVDWHTSTVQDVRYVHGLYKVKTLNSVYVCFPMQ